MKMPRISHTNRNTAKSCSGESEARIGGPVADDLHFRAPADLHLKWRFRIAHHLHRPVVHGRANGPRTPVHRVHEQPLPCRMAGRSARTREGTRCARQRGFRWSSGRFPNRSTDAAGTKALLTTSKARQQHAFDQHLGTTVTSKTFSNGVKQPYVDSAVGPVAVWKALQEGQPVDWPWRTRGEHQEFLWRNRAGPGSGGLSKTRADSRMTPATKTLEAREVGALFQRHKRSG